MLNVGIRGNRSVRVKTKEAQGPDASDPWGITFHPSRFWFVRFAPPGIKVLSFLAEARRSVNERKEERAAP
jgi:hypothetical protein